MFLIPKYHFGPI